jgi:hypothetical protein
MRGETSWRLDGLWMTLATGGKRTRFETHFDRERGVLKRTVKEYGWGVGDVNWIDGD